MKLFEKCQYCDSRHVGCHTKCPAYLRDKKRLDEMKAKQRSDNDYIGYVIDNLKRKRR